MSEATTECVGSTISVEEARERYGERVAQQVETAAMLLQLQDNARRRQRAPGTVYEDEDEAIGGVRCMNCRADLDECSDDGSTCNECGAEN